MLPVDCKKVLIVEDDENIRDALAEVLTDDGYSVAMAGNGREALDWLRSQATHTFPCVILLDLMMPVMDGFEFRREQLRDPELATIPVVVLSADGNAKDKAASIGAAEGLRKPLELEDVLEAVARHCE